MSDAQTPTPSRGPRWLSLYWPPRGSIYKQILEEFWLPTVAAGIIASVKYYLLGGDFWTLFGTAWVLSFFWTNAYVRIWRQQTQDSAIETLGKQVQRIGADVISISENLPKGEPPAPLLLNIAQSTLSANNALREISATMPSESTSIPADVEYHRFVVRLTPEQEQKLQSLTKKSE